MTDVLKEATELFGSNAIYIAEVYEQYLRDPSSVDESWQKYFQQFGDSQSNVANDFYGPQWNRKRSQVLGATNPEAAIAKGKEEGKGGRQQASDDSIHAHMLIRAYRVRGHLIARLDPLGLTNRESHPELDPAHYGFSDDDYDREIYIGGWLGHEKLTLRQILTTLKETYCSHLAVEFIHIQSLEKKEWLEKRLEGTLSKPTLGKEERKSILQQLTEVVGFEEFLHVKYPGAKRFSVEGGEALIPALEAVAQTAGKQGVSEIVLGMPHRGRLNVLTAFMKKPYAAMLSEFEGNLATPAGIVSSGDVKYHLGISSDRDIQGHNVHMSLNPNPSHLEAVNPVVCGRTRAKQDQMGDTERLKAMGILIHGDAAFCGQGVVAEGLMMADLEGYSSGGTVHIVVNNQIGFTTSPKEGHASPYPTDLAMTIQAPIFHVNGDDPEAVIHACRIATEYRMQFKKDVVIDIFCYRKHGHNEGDEPMFTNPIMYTRIKDKQTPRDVYASRLISDGVISADEYEGMKSAWHNALEKEHEASKNYEPNKADWLEGKWTGMSRPDEGVKAATKTGVDLKELKELGKTITEVPKGFKLNKKVERLLSQRREMIDSGEGIDWGMGEHLAFATLLADGHPIRLSGQDVQRGTFSHRHSSLVNQENEERYWPLNNLGKKQKAKYEAINSNLSEYAVLGYEYGYSVTEPNALTIWEAQFGDFSNGAQIMIDQFIASAETKWLRMSGLVMLLPHGYEGQGPEHSSARLERYLQLCAQDNMQVVNCTTPANIFHVLRRQMRRDFRKPLIVMSPKSLLRLKAAQSKLEDFGPKTSFQRVIPETEKLVADAKVKRVVLCSGKVYYELLETRTEAKIKDVALVRVEQYYPFPYDEVAAQASKYPNAEVVWCQEEPENMGAWQFVDRKIEEALGKSKSKKASRPSYVGRPASASPAAGYMKIHKIEQEKLIKEALQIK